MFTKEDIQQIENKGISLSELNYQINQFKEGFPFITLSKPATIHDGILKLGLDDEKKYIDLFDSYAKERKLLKFVPASGAATRMFKDLFSFIESDRTLEQFPTVKEVVENIHQFAFYDYLAEKLKEQGFNIKSIDSKCLIETIINEKGLNYGSLPKALLLFHKYGNKARTSLEEHLVEGALYCTSENDTVYLHFTVSPEHRKAFEKVVSDNLNEYSSKYGIKYQIDYSVQLPSTDTIAVDLENMPFRDKSGKLVFRPGGHGALIHNLNAIDADIIFIKNIDNIVPDRLKDETIKYKKIIAGFLVFLEKNIFRFQESFDKNEFNEKLYNELIVFYKKYFHRDLELLSFDEIRKIVFSSIRVCGMVKNEGEPGGGPFWTKGKNGNISLQIVESSQVDFKNEEQAHLFNQATHFNPVDLVCSVKNYKKEKYDLTQYIDAKTGFISQKSKDGKPLKALELPGLWNGAMAYWNTIFVEVPIETFNPVKTINDLLRPQHLNM